MITLMKSLNFILIMYVIMHRISSFVYQGPDVTTPIVSKNLYVSAAVKQFLKTLHPS